MIEWMLPQALKSNILGTRLEALTFLTRFIPSLFIFTAAYFYVE